jgi:hypothetical protein
MSRTARVSLMSVCKRNTVQTSPGMCEVRNVDEEGKNCRQVKQKAMEVENIETSSVNLAYFQSRPQGKADCTLYTSATACSGSQGRSQTIHYPFCKPRPYPYKCTGIQDISLHLGTQRFVISNTSSNGCHGLDCSIVFSANGLWPRSVALGQGRYSRRQRNGLVG